MNHVPMLGDILGQPASLQEVISHASSAGLLVMAEVAKMVHACSGKIIIAGMGASLFAAMPLAQALEAAGYRIVLKESSELLHFGKSSFRKEDLAILISRSGGSVETVELAAMLNQHGVRTIGVTNLPSSPLEGLVTLNLSVNSQPDELIAVRTYTGTMLALLLLGEQITGLGEPELAFQCESLLPTLNRYIHHSLEQSDRWERFFSGGTPLYILGRGSALAAGCEGALLFHETAKAATIAMSSGQFRHGPVEVVSPEFRALIIGTSGAAAWLDWQLAKNLQLMNGSVVWLGPSLEAAEPNVDRLVSWPEDLPAILTPLFDVVPLQVAAYRTALWKGLRPGAFRYASEITENESGFPLFEASLA